MPNSGQFKKGNKINVGRKRGPMSAEQKQKLSNALKNRVISTETRKKMSDARANYKHSEETKRKIGKALKGKKSHFWRGGITPKNLLVRQSIEYDLWKAAVFTRDEHICCSCGQKGGELNAHHIKPFAYFKTLRFAIDNGETLCEKCHRDRHALRKAN